MFSSFAILLSFKLRNLLKGVGQIVEWSIRDESMHSDAGCWLFRTLLKERSNDKKESFTQSVSNYRAMKNLPTLVSELRQARIQFEDRKDKTMLK